MSELQKSSQEGLVKSKKTSQDSNASIKAMLVLREKGRADSTSGAGSPSGEKKYASTSCAIR